MSEKKTKKVVLSGKPLNTAAMNLAIYGKMDPDTPSEAERQACRRYMKFVGGCDPADIKGKVIIFSTSGNIDGNHSWMWPSNKPDKT